MPPALVLSILIFSNKLLDAQEKEFTQTGQASFYADKFEGKTTANGEIYYHVKKTAAHPNLPFGSIVKVTNLENNKFVVVRINDRGPFVNHRIIDLSKSAAGELDFIEKGLAKVRIELIASTDELPDRTEITKKNDAKPVYYKIDVKEISPKGKGIQIGSFSSNENFLRLTDNISNKYNETVFIEINQSGNQQLYRVIIGNYQSEYELKRLKNKLSAEYPDCFIVTFK